MSFDLETLRRRRDEAVAARDAKIAQLKEAALSSEQPVDQLPVLQAQANELLGKLDVLREALSSAPSEGTRNAISADIKKLEGDLEVLKKTIHEAVEAANLMNETNAAEQDLAAMNKPVEKVPATASAKFVA
jgi:hypothetical protein